MLCFSVLSVKAMQYNSLSDIWNSVRNRSAWMLGSSYANQEQDCDGDEKDLWVYTSDGEHKCIPKDVLRYCNRLKLAHRFYPHNDAYNLLPVGLSSQELDVFIAALIDPARIDYDKEDIYTIMKVADKCGAFLLYALCVSNCLQNMVLEDIDKRIIVPYLEEVMSTLTITLDKDGKHDSALCQVTNWMEEPERFFIKNANYAIEKKRKKRSSIDHNAPIEDFYSPYVVYDNNGQVVRTFESYSNAGIRVRPHLFKDKNVLIYYTCKSKYGPDSVPIAHIYDLDAKKEIRSFKFNRVVITNDEKFIVDSDLDRVVIYNCENINNIKLKVIELRENAGSCSAYYSPNGKKIALGYYRKTERNHGLLIYNMEDFKWDTAEVPQHVEIDLCNIDVMEMEWGIDSSTLFIALNTRRGEEEKYKIIRLNDASGSTVEDCPATPLGISGLAQGIELCIDNSRKDENYYYQDIYHINDLSTPLYGIKRAGKSESNFFPSYPSFIKMPAGRAFFIMKYDKHKNVIKKMTDNIVGHVKDINDKGWFVTGDQDCYDQYNTCLYNNCGKKLIEIACAQKKLGQPQFSCRQDKFIVMFDRDNNSSRLCYSVPLACVKPTDYFTEITTKQVALFMSVRNKSDCHIYKDDIADHIVHSFAKKDRAKVCDILKIEYK